jgi:hypothetical protein
MDEHLEWRVQKLRTFEVRTQAVVGDPTRTEAALDAVGL